MNFDYFIAPIHEPLSSALRSKLFIRMQKEGLLPFAMHAYACPTVQDWLTLTNPHEGSLVCAVPTGLERLSENICGMALLKPIQGRVWSFDFTVFREHFQNAIPLSRGVLPWIFTHMPCDAIMGFSAKSNAHAWRLAQKAGFKVLGSVPGACYMAHKLRYEEGVLVLAERPKQSAYAHKIPKIRRAYTSSRPSQMARPMMRTKSCVCSQLSTSMGL